MDERVKMSEEEIKSMVAIVEHVLTVGHGQIVTNVADHKIISQKHEAQWELRNNGGKKKEGS